MSIALSNPINILSLEEFLALSETKPASEYIDGQIHQKSMPQFQHSTFQTEISSCINQIGKQKKVAFAFPELRCNFGGVSIVLDIAVLRWQNIPFQANGRVADQVPREYCQYDHWCIQKAIAHPPTTQVLLFQLSTLAP